MNFSNNFLSAIQGVKDVVITTHIFPDADGIGSQIGLSRALKQKSIKSYCVNHEDLPSRFCYLDTDKDIKSLSKMKEELPKSIDLLIVTDTNDLDRIGDVKELETRAKKVLYIDHHPCKELPAGEHCIVPTKAATGELVAQILLDNQFELTKEIALPLFTAILVDTSSFRYPNVTSATHQIAQRLLDTGISANDVYNKAYGTKKVQYLHLLGNILSSAQATKNGKIAWITFDQSLIENHKSHVDDTHSFINHLLILDGVKIACMFRIEEKIIKLSLRSHGDIDVGTIASKLNGGGHSHSAAVRFDRNQADEVIISQAILFMEDILEDWIKKH